MGPRAGPARARPVRFPGVIDGDCRHSECNITVLPKAAAVAPEPHGFVYLTAFMQH